MLKRRYWLSVTQSYIDENA